eukprot:CAMPEP_0198500882 /NCGR_PEP_ID=MMETSP1462-20131121/8397_1 /TAXON_ID=1333877 /ORGANISM="Brandtodinium nutriculum, Strain RCC3387" /LENGTH=160 /DNA_ID=CAMNT_0044229901 /DNA_START=129 /DNA_END=608 /DNA_ORIENTATION=-
MSELVPALAMPFGASAAGGVICAQQQLPQQRGASVPPDFTVRSTDTVDSARGPCLSLSAEQKAQEMAALQAMIHSFVREVVDGIVLDVVLEDGKLLPCRCTMDSQLTTVSLQAALQVRDAARRIRLADIQDICSGKELANMRTTTPLDDMCVTLAMASDQ